MQDIQCGGCEHLGGCPGDCGDRHYEREAEAELVDELTGEDDLTPIDPHLFWDEVSELDERRPVAPGESTEH